jgi:predicted metal-dependent hydrolase
VLRDWYIARVKETILDRVEQHARVLAVKYKTASIVDNRYRWGSCTVNIPREELALARPIVDR